MNRKEYLIELVKEFAANYGELEWIEFKVNNQSPDRIGEYISALSNSATLSYKKHAYMIWGIEDGSREIVGTSFDPFVAKKGNEDIIPWLSRLLEPCISFIFEKIQIDGKNVVVLEIERAKQIPVKFSGSEFIRIGSSKKKLKDYPEKEKMLWQIFNSVNFEEDVSLQNIEESEVLKYIDYPAYFDLLNIPLPESRISILAALESDEIIVSNEIGKWEITNLGAILFARNLKDFTKLRRKAVRVIQYSGNDRINCLREQVGSKGYASGFEGLVEYVDNLLPTNEVVGKALRKEVSIYPQLAIRELIANAIIHQDFSQTGTGPMIEIFDNRMEITNPGIPLINTDRFLDSPPKSRNERLASMMRRMGICEERGSGIDKVVHETEFFQLPAPIIEVTGDHTRVVLFAYKKFSKMSMDDKVRACYLHACLKYVMRESMTNSSLRERFGLDEKSSATVSRIIKESVKRELIKLKDPKTAPRYYKYEPFWS